MGLKMRVCNICGKMFKVNGSQVYCSETCSKKGKSNNNRLHEKEDKIHEKEELTIVKAKKTYKKPELSIAQVCKLAKEKGLSYGQYVGKYGV